MVPCPTNLGLRTLRIQLNLRQLRLCCVAVASGYAAALVFEGQADPSSMVSVFSFLKAERPMSKSSCQPVAALFRKHNLSHCQGSGFSVEHQP